MFSDDRIDAIRQRTCQGCAFAWCAFFDVVSFWSYWPQSSPKLSKDVFFGEKRRPFNGKMSKIRYKRIHRHTDSRQVSRKSVKRKWPNRCAVFIMKKGWHFAPFSVANSEAISPKFLQDNSFPIPISLPSFVQTCSVFEEIYPKMSPRLITVSAWSL